MIENSISEISERCINKWKTKAYLASAVAMSFGVLSILARYYTRHNTGLTIFLIVAFGILLYRFFNSVILRGCKKINALIGKIEINGDKVSFETLYVSLFFNLVVKPPISVVAAKSEISLKESPSNFDFDKALTRKIYVVECGNGQYLLAENFFQNFSSIKGSLESTINKKTV